MIKTKNGATAIRGTLPEVCTDLTLIIREFRKCLSDDKTEAEIEKLIADAVSLSKKSGSELADEIENRLLKMLFGVDVDA